MSILVAVKEDGLAKDTQGAQLAHIADTVTSLDERFVEMREVQGAIVAILTRLLETVQAQSEMLAEVLSAAREEPGPSPVAQQLERLTVAVTENSESVREMAGQLERLPGEIGEAFAQAASPASAEPRR